MLDRFKHLHRERASFSTILIDYSLPTENYNIIHPRRDSYIVRLEQRSRHKGLFVSRYGRVLRAFQLRETCPVRRGENTDRKCPLSCREAKMNVDRPSYDPPHSHSESHLAVGFAYRPLTQTSEKTSGVLRPHGDIECANTIDVQLRS